MYVETSSFLFFPIVSVKLDWQKLWKLAEKLPVPAKTLIKTKEQKTFDILLKLFLSRSFAT